MKEVIIFLVGAAVGVSALMMFAYVHTVVRRYRAINQAKKGWPEADDRLQ